MHDSHIARVVLIGLDGATWDLLKPWADAGNLPTLARLIRGGCWGQLESTIPPITIPAWISLATGLNPGKIGAFDFLSRKDNTYKLYPVSSANFRRKTLWHHIATAGNAKVGIIDYPGLFPVYPINGFLVSNTAFCGTRDSFFPQALRKALDEVCHGYEDFVGYHDKKYDDTGLFLSDLHRVLSKQIAAVHYLLKQPWDLFVYVLSATDWAQHLMWKYIDSSHPLYDSEEARKYGAEFLKFWQRVDDFLGEIVEATQGSNLFLVSDHGFGPQDECFSLAKWLEVKGYLVRKDSIARKIYRSMKDAAFSLLIPLGRTKLRRVIPNRFVKGAAGRLRADIAEQIDFGRSRAYVLGHTIPFGAIYINREGRDPQGFVKEEEYEALKSEVISSLRDLKSDVGKDVEVEIFEARDIYRGPYVQHAPDIVFAIDDWRCIVNEERFDDALFENEPYSNRHTGSHRMNGIFLAYGPDIKDSGEELNGLKIYDIAPTILQMFGVPIPGDMDGRVLKEIFEETSQFATKETQSTEPDEKQRVRKRIEGLKSRAKI